MVLLKASVEAISTGNTVYTEYRKAETVMRKRSAMLLLVLCLAALLALTPAAQAETLPFPFTDVGLDDWFCEPVVYVNDHGLMTGVGNGLFDPQGEVSRAMVVTILYRLDGQPALTAEANYSCSDVDANSWYGPAVAWAESNAIVKGYGNGKFGPHDPVTREQFAAFLQRYAEYKNYDVTSQADLSAFADAGRISAWAKPALSWANGKGLITGKSADILDPAGTATRAEAAAILMRFCKLYDVIPVGPVNPDPVNPDPDKPSSGGDHHGGNWGDDPGPDPDPDPEDDIPAEALADNDNDGVPAYMEEYFGTSNEKNDTDGDGVSDFDELFRIRTEPLEQDSDGNGVSDGDEDADGDGIANKNEAKQGTNIAKADTDSDGLKDGDELKTYGTDPLNYDSDGDGMYDGDEVAQGTDPLQADAAFAAQASAVSADGSVTASAELSLPGAAVDSLTVTEVDDPSLFPEDFPGLVAAFDFSADAEVNAATVSFEFDPAAVEDPADLVICYFNKETQELEELETTVSGNVASAAVSHFSTYVLIKRSVYQGSFVWEDTWEVGDDAEPVTYSGIEIILIIDDSGSMTWNDNYNQRLAVARDLVDKLPENSSIGIVRFENSNLMLTNGLITDKEEAKACLTTEYFRSSGGTYMYTAIDDSFASYGTEDSDVLKMMVVLSDGDSFDTGRHSNTIATAKASGVHISTVGLGTGSSYYFTNYLKPLAEETGGQFYLASNAGELANIYGNISRQIDLETDTDGDGIPDYYEDHMVSFNGTRIMLDKTKADTDGDGLLDGEEVKIELVYNADKTKVYVKGMIVSDPCLEDTDYDGVRDDVDPAPHNNYFSGTLTTKLATSPIETRMDYRWFTQDYSKYNQQLSTMSLLYAADAYTWNAVQLRGTLKGRYVDSYDIEALMAFFGMNKTKTINLKNIYKNDYDVTEVSFGYHTFVVNGELTTVLAVFVRGTDETLAEWASNFDIGDSSKAESYYDWGNRDNHKGFDVAANRVMNEMDLYINDNGLYEDNLVYWVTGHSRGGGVANIIGAKLEDEGKTAYTYTFAAPNTTLNQDSGSHNYPGIFNLVNSDDFVPYLPAEAWGYSRYGSTLWNSIKDGGYELDWEIMTGCFDYNPDYGLEDTIDKISAILPAGQDPRIGCYKYTCKDHGDGSIDKITVKWKKADLEIIPENAKPFCVYEETDSKKGTLCQEPAYLMQLMAAVSAKTKGSISGYRFAVDLDIADRYEDAKGAIVKTSNNWTGGIKDPHAVESYYILSQEDWSWAF